jgi:hypothetical protein
MGRLPVARGRRTRTSRITYPIERGKGKVRRFAVLAMLVMGLSPAAVQPALAQSVAALSIGSEAVLVARGAAVRVPVQYSCPVDPSGSFLNVFVTQRVDDGRLTRGSGNTSLTCDGALHTVVVTVPADSQTAFRRGTALAQADLQSCSEFGCTSTRAEQVIEVVRK